MEFNEAIKKLGIEKYATRIWNSNSHGELFHLQDYILIAEQFECCGWFPEWLDSIVKFAEDNWSRPESVFQHIPKLLKQSLSKATK